MKWRCGENHQKRAEGEGGGKMPDYDLYIGRRDGRGIDVGVYGEAVIPDILWWNGLAVRFRPLVYLSYII